MVTSKVTVPAHYSFTVDPVENSKTYGLNITTNPDGSFTVVGNFDAIESYVSDICIDDDESIDDIMDTVEDV